MAAEPADTQQKAQKARTPQRKAGSAFAYAGGMAGIAVNAAERFDISRLGGARAARRLAVILPVYAGMYFACVTPFTS